MFTFRKIKPLFISMAVSLGAGLFSWLLAGNPMEQQDGGMRTRFSGGIEYGQQPAPLAGNQNPVDIRAAVAAVPRSLTSRKHAHSQ